MSVTTNSTTPADPFIAKPSPAMAKSTQPAAPKAASKVVHKKPVSIPKVPTKSAVKTPAKAAAKSIAKPVIEIQTKVKKPKLVRDSFTIPKAEYTVLDDLKQRAVKLGTSTKKSELIRAGIKALAAMPDTPFLSALSAVPAIKTGRPAKD